MNTNAGGQSQSEQRREAASRAKEEQNRKAAERERDDDSYDNLPFTD